MPAPVRSFAPPLPLLHFSFLFAGSATLLLGSTLPVYAQRWQLHDSQSGVLIAAQFLGLFSGSILLLNHLRSTLLCGYSIAAAGFLFLAAAFAHPGGYLIGTASFFFLGFGLGQVTTTVNLLSALHYHAPERRSSRLSLLNFTWSGGAVLSPLLAGLFLAHSSLTALQLAFALTASALLAATALLIPRTATAQPAADAAPQPALPLLPLLYFFGCFLLYGGLEATVGNWLSTYTLRYTSLDVASAAYCTTALWASFAVGRALAAGVLRYVPENVVRVAGILLTTAATIALRGTHTALGIGVDAGLIGLGIAPFFAITFSRLISRKPQLRQAGAATANIGLGSALFPYLTGTLSTHLGSLHTAMWMPIGISFALLTACLLQPRES